MTGTGPFKNPSERRCGFVGLRRESMCLSNKSITFSTSTEVLCSILSLFQRPKATLSMYKILVEIKMTWIALSESNFRLTLDNLNSQMFLNIATLLQAAGDIGLESTVCIPIPIRVRLKHPGGSVAAKR